MQPTGRRDLVKLNDILILIITGNADSPGRVWLGGRGAVGVEERRDMGVKWAIIVMIIN